MQIKYRDNKTKLVFAVTLLTVSVSIPFSMPAQQLKWLELAIQVESSFRAISVVDDSTAWIAGNNGTIGMTRNGGKTWEFMQIRGAEKADFRSVYAFGRLEALVANAGSPARIYRTSDGGQHWMVVMQDDHPQAFIDAIDFTDHINGFALGDPRNGRAMVLRTADGGLRWQALKTSPATEPGESFFAASSTALRCLPDGEVIIGSGGNSSRVLISKDKGMNWTSGVIPEAIHFESGGVFSVCFSDAENGMAVGGDYKQETKIGLNSWFTSNGGKKWKPATTPVSGYRSCVEKIGRNLWLAVGPAGADISTDGGRSWTLEPGIRAHVVRMARNGKLVLMAGNNKIWRLESR